MDQRFAVDNDPAWASPGSVADAPRARSLPTQFEPVAPPRRSLAGSPVDRLQPRSVGQLLDGGFEVLRFRFRTIAQVAAAVVLPLYAVPQAVAALFGVARTDTFAILSTTDASSQAVSDLWTGVVLANLAQLGLMLANLFMGVALGHLVISWLDGRDPTAAETLRFVRSRLVTCLGAFVLALLCKLAGLVACGVGLLFVVPALSVLGPVIGAEGVGAGESVSRSFALTRRRFGTPLGVMVLWWIASGLVGSAAQGAVAGIAALLTSSESGLLIGAQVATVVVSVVLNVVQSAVTVLLYVDLRVRTEGLDLHLESVERFG